MHRPESDQENETHKIHCDFEIERDHLFLASKQDVKLINRNKLSPFAIQAYHKVIIEKKQKMLGSYSRTKKVLKTEGYNDTNCGWCTWNDPKGLRKKTERNENQCYNQNHWDHSFVKII